MMRSNSSICASGHHGENPIAADARVVDEPEIGPNCGADLLSCCDGADLRKIERDEAHRLSTVAPGALSMAAVQRIGPASASASTR